MRASFVAALAGAGGAAVIALWSQKRRSSQLRNARAEGGRSATCRICFEEAPIRELVSPCNCTGTIVRRNHARLTTLDVLSPDVSRSSPCLPADRLIFPQAYVHEACERRWQAERGSGACSVCRSPSLLPSVPGGGFATARLLPSRRAPLPARRALARSRRLAAIRPPSAGAESPPALEPSLPPPHRPTSAHSVVCPVQTGLLGPHSAGSPDSHGERLHGSDRAAARRRCRRRRQHARRCASAARR